MIDLPDLFKIITEEMIEGKARASFKNNFSFVMKYFVIILIIVIIVTFEY